MRGEGPFLAERKRRGGARDQGTSTDLRNWLYEVGGENRESDPKWRGWAVIVVSLPRMEPGGWGRLWILFLYTRMGNQWWIRYEEYDPGERSPLETALGIVCTQVLIKPMGLIGGCHRRGPEREKSETDPKQARRGAAQGGRMVPCWMLPQGCWGWSWWRTIKCCLESEHPLLFKPHSFLYCKSCLCFLFSLAARRNFSKSTTKQKSNLAFLHLYRSCHILTITLHWVFSCSQIESCTGSFSLSFADLFIRSTTVIK